MPRTNIMYVSEAQSVIFCIKYQEKKKVEEREDDLVTLVSLFNSGQRWKSGLRTV